MILRTLVVLATIVALIPAVTGDSVAAQEADGDGALLMDALEMTIGGRLQTQFSTTSVDGSPTEGPQPSTVFFRRARLEFTVEVSDRVSGTIQPDFAGGQASLTDAYMRFAASPGLQVVVGRAYRPFGLLQQTSSKRILPIERGLRIRGVQDADEFGFVSGLGYSNRDLGLQLQGAPEDAPYGLDYAVGVFRGPLHGQVGDRDSYQTAARVTATATDEVRVGLGWSSRDFGAFGPGGWDLERGNAFEIDVEYGSFAPGPHLLAEISHGTLDPFADTDFFGVHGWFGFRTEELEDTGLTLEPLLRLSHGRTSGAAAETAPPGGTLVTPGVNLYFTPVNRIMVNYDIWESRYGTDARSFKMMFQLAF